VEPSQWAIIVYEQIEGRRVKAKEHERKMMSKKTGHVPHILFVCLGNTCRSPMAEAIAKKLFGSSACITSAGIAPYFEGAVPETVKTVKACFGVDIMSHKTKDLETVKLSKFDLIIAMDYYVFERITVCNPSLNDRLLKWDIEDPYGKDMDAYTKCAKRIEQYVRALLDELDHTESSV
jgi:protein-tyrosine-phosphatase